VTAFKQAPIQRAGQAWLVHRHKGEKQRRAAMEVDLTDSQTMCACKMDKKQSHMGESRSVNANEHSKSRSRDRS
jgi:hypothetical protein